MSERGKVNGKRERGAERKRVKKRERRRGRELMLG